MFSFATKPQILLNKKITFGKIEVTEDGIDPAYQD